jgi:dihydrofolate reductase
MRIVVSQFISLDGVTQAPGGAEEDTDGGFRHGGWSGQFFDADVIGAAWSALAERSDALLEGRRTWQVSAEAWPGQSGDPFSDWINTVQKYVVTDTLADADVAAWTPTTIIRPADLEAEVSAMRERGGGDVTVLGSSAVVRALMSADLVDELQLILEPIVLGGGKSIFPYDAEDRVLELISATTASTGVQVCNYARAR